MNKKKRLEYLDITFLNLSLGKRIKYSVVSSFILSFMLMIMFGYQDDLSSARVFLFSCFVIVFFLLFLFISSKFARVHKFNRKKSYFHHVKEVKFKLKDVNKLLSYIIMVVLVIYILFLIVFLFCSLSDMVLMLIIIFIGILVIYYILFFKHKFSYVICKKGLLVYGFGLPKFYKWRSMKGFKVRRKLVYFYFKNASSSISLPCSRSVGKYLKKIKIKKIRKLPNN